MSPVSHVRPSAKVDIIIRAVINDRQSGASNGGSTQAKCKLPQEYIILQHSDATYKACLRGHACFGDCSQHAPSRSWAPQWPSAPFTKHHALGLAQPCQTITRLWVCLQMRRQRISRSMDKPCCRLFAMIRLTMAHQTVLQTLQIQPPRSSSERSFQIEAFRSH